MMKIVQESKGFNSDAGRRLVVILCESVGILKISNQMSAEVQKFAEGLM